MPENPLEKHSAALRDVLGWLTSEKTPHVVIGALAVGFRGRPRMTNDIDLVVLAPAEKWGQLVEKAAMHNIEPRISDAVAFADRARVLLLRHRPSGTSIDVSIGLLPFEEEMIAKASPVRVLGMEVPVPSAEDLVVMKAVAGRLQDWLDVEGIAARTPQLDKEYVFRWVEQFAQVLEAPELIEKVRVSLGN